MSKRVIYSSENIPKWMREDYVNWMSEFNQKNDYLSANFDEVTPLEFYSDIFEADTIEAPGQTGKPCPIITVTVNDKDGNIRKNQFGKPLMWNVTVFNDYEALKKAKNNDFALCGMCTFSGNKKSAKFAYKLHGFCIDLDGVGAYQLESVIMQCQADIIPYPTYIANSGHGVHLYYVFENPVPLYPRLIKPLQHFKKELTRTVWNIETSEISTKDRQYQGIYQNFRMVGSKSKLAWDRKNQRFRKKTKYIIRAFKIGKKVDFSYLNHYVPERVQIDTSTDWASMITPEITPLNRAKELWPDWYERRILDGAPKEHYICYSGLYDWWLRQIPEVAKDGNRYWCIAFIFVYAVKCNIEKDFAMEDAMNLIPLLDHMTTRADNPFTEDDVLAASQMYKSDSIDCPLSFIEEKTGAHFKRNRRNGRPQDVHVKIMTATRDALYPNGSWRNKNGRPKGTDKSKIVKYWREKHPNGTKAQCERETGLSRHTVLKWW